MVDFMKANHFCGIAVRGRIHDHPCGWDARAVFPDVGNHKFETKQLDQQKETCETHCFTLNHILGWCYNDQRVIKYFFKQLAHGFQGMSGQM
jgi:hypothetical protein